MTNVSAMRWLVVACALSTKAPAQSPAVVPGAFVRFTATSSQPPARVTGRVLRIARDSISIERERWVSAQRIDLKDSVSLPLSAISDVEARIGRKRHWLVGLGVGAVTGGLIGSVAGRNAGQSVVNGGCQNQNALTCVGSASIGSALLEKGLVAGALVGGFLGTIVGAVVVTDRWSPAQLWSTGRFEIAPRPNGIAFGRRITVGAGFD